MEEMSILVLAAIMQIAEEAQPSHLMRRPPPRAATSQPRPSSTLTSFFTTLIHDPQALAIPARISRALHLFTRGVQDSVSIQRTIEFFSSSDIRTASLNIMGLNVLLFLGSVALYSYAIVPIVQWYGAFIYRGHERQRPPVWLEKWVLWFIDNSYEWVWMWPLFVLSFFVNLGLNKEIAAAGFSLKYPEEGPRESPAGDEVLIDEIKRFFMMYILLFQTLLLWVVPWLGGVTSFIFTCWLHAFYAFQYVWAYQGIPVNRQTAMMELHWTYFLGFGFFTSLLCFITPFFIGVGIYAVLFPFCILLALTSNPFDEPDGESARRVSLGRAPVFEIPRKISTLLVSDVVGRTIDPRTRARGR